jgi:hypothetical protein
MTQPEITEFLFEIFKTKKGIFSASTDEIKKDFNDEAERLKTAKKEALKGKPDASDSEVKAINKLSFKPDSTAIAQLKKNIIELSNNPLLSHICVSYGLAKEANNFKLITIWSAVLLDGSGGGENLHLPLTVFSDKCFSSTNLQLASKNTFDGEIALFSETFTKIYGVKKFVTDAFITFSELIFCLTKLEIEGADKVSIEWGFRKSHPNDDFMKDFQCLHLIFKGNKGKLVFSTFDGELAYSGPKPGRPPIAP